MTAHAKHSDHGFAHPQPVWVLLAVFFALIFLTILTVLQSMLPLGNFEIWASLIIASVKASLVIFFFMHLGWDKPFNAIVFLSSVLFLALFLGFTLMDREAYRYRLEPIVDEVVAAESADHSEEAPTPQPQG